MQKAAERRPTQANVASYSPVRRAPELCGVLWALCLGGPGVCSCPATPRVTESVTVCELLTPWLLRSPCCAVIFMLWVIFNSSHNIWGGGGRVGSLLFHQERHLNILSSREFQGLREKSETVAPDLSDTLRSRGLH